MMEEVYEKVLNVISDIRDNVDDEEAQRLDRIKEYIENFNE